MPANIDYEKSVKYTDFETIYTECSGPGGLKLAEFIASKLALKPQDRLLDIGLHGGYQTCFLAKEYGVFAVGIDPGDDHGKPGTSSVDRLMRNAQSWGVQDRILGIKVGVPDTKFAENSFDAAYSTTTLEMIRGWASEEEYRECLSEVLRVLRPGGLFGYGDPMHFDVEMPPELVPLVTHWVDFFVTLRETVEAFRDVGFEIIEADYAPDARLWWEEYRQYDPDCRANALDIDAQAIQVDRGRWLTYGYVIAKKPE